MSENVKTLDWNRMTDAEKEEEAFLDLKRELCDHVWHTVDDSFDHEFGTEVIVYDECELCGKTRPHERYEGPED